MKRTGLVTLLSAVLLTACVPQRAFQEMENKYKDAEARSKSCGDSLSNLLVSHGTLSEQNQYLFKENERLRTDSTELASLLERTKKLYGDLHDTYERLLKNNESESSRMLSELKDMETKLRLRDAEITSKEMNYTAVSHDLEGMKKDLESREQRVRELERVLNQKDSAVNALKNTLSKALLGFQDKGLSIDVRNGKVYVSLEEQLLFASGSTTVDKKGEEALIELAKALQKQPDINILVEGHTDDVPMKSATIKDNWDLSVLRATSIVKILTEKGKVDPKRLIASGRGEFFPIDPAKTTDARRKNRRTEIILTPKLDELFQILGN